MQKIDERQRLARERREELEKQIGMTNTHIVIKDNVRVPLQHI